MCICAVRELSAKLLGIAAMALSTNAGVALLSSLAAAAAGADEKAAKFEEVQGSVAALGYVLAQFLTGNSLLSASMPRDACSRNVPDFIQCEASMPQTYGPPVTGQTSCTLL